VSEGVIEVVGIGEDGWDGLSPAARRIVESADLLVGGARHLELVPGAGAERLAWPKPLTGALDTLDARSAEGTVVVLATGNPLWYGVANLLPSGCACARTRAPSTSPARGWAGLRRTSTRSPCTAGRPRCCKPSCSRARAC
jgi:precorrin-6Y C5,15-methyltransferase (decarboxylating)